MRSPYPQTAPFSADNLCLLYAVCRCMYEAWQTLLVREGQGFHVLLYPQADVINTLLWGGIDVSRAQATQPQDRERILAQMAAGLGLEEINRRLKSAIIEATVPGPNSAFEKVQKLVNLRDVPTDERLAQVAAILRDKEAQVGAQHPDALKIVAALGAMCDTAGRRDEALDWYRRALDGRTAALGTSHSATLASAQSVAGMLERLKRHDEALVLRQRVYDACRAKLAADDAAIRYAAKDLGAALSSLKRYTEARRQKLGIGCETECMHCTVSSQVHICSN